MNIMYDFGFTSSNKDAELDYINRESNKQDIYFVVDRHARKGIIDFEYRYLADLPDRYE